MTGSLLDDLPSGLVPLGTPSGARFRLPCDAVKSPFLDWSLR